MLGPDHPDVLATCNNIAYWSGKSGDAAAALQLSRELLPDRVRVLGPDHPDVLTTRNNITAWTGQHGDAAGRAAAVPGAAARPGPGAGPRSPRRPDHPQQHHRLDRPAR